MKEIMIKSLPKRVRKVRSLMESVGDKIGSVHFVKRSDGKKRRMSYRLHVRKPSYARKPSGNKWDENRAKDSDRHLITVFDTNMVRRNKQGKMCGRGGYKSVPLDGVYRLKVCGEIYRIK